MAMYRTEKEMEGGRRKGWEDGREEDGQQQFS